MCEEETREQRIDRLTVEYVDFCEEQHIPLSINDCRELAEKEQTIHEEVEHMSIPKATKRYISDRSLVF